jgi:Ca-activated chloride channel family protein
MEEFVNAFDYNYPRQASDTFNIHAAGMPSPFGRGLALLKIGVQARVLGRAGRRPAHLVFVIDTSGSMDLPDRLPLVQLSVKMLVGQLDARDSVSLVTYGAEPRIVLEAVSASARERIGKAVESIRCIGATNLSQGLHAGYEIAHRQFKPGWINRVVLCSDGVANVGDSEATEILEKVAQYRTWGITLTTAGFGAGSYSDEMLEKLANSGDGNYVFVDSPREARRVFVEKMSATIQVVAFDAKIQVDFDPHVVRRYRLIGYENRDIADKDFRNDAVDAGEVGSGQSVTALYEIELEPTDTADAALGTVYVRYKHADTRVVKEIARELRTGAIRPATPEQAPRLYLAACAAEFAELLRGSEHAEGGRYDRVAALLRRVAAALPIDRSVRELWWLVARAGQLKGER